MNLSHLLSPDSIICDVKGNTREEVYLEMLNLVPRVGDKKVICDEIIKHEELIGMPNELGLAIPHTRTAGVEDLHIVIGIHKEGVILKSNDTTKTHVIVMCLISKSTSNVYLLTLGAVSKFFIKPGNLEKISACATPQEVMKVFQDEKVEIKHTITAEDVMSTDFVSATKDSSVKDIIDLMTTSGHGRVAVLNDQKELEGVVTIRSIFKSGIPEYILMMDNLKFLPNLEPFDQLLANEDQMQGTDFINRTPDTISPSTPLIQIIVKLVKKDVLAYYVVDDQNRPIGVITEQELITNVLRG